MKIEEYDPRRHFGVGGYDLVLKRNGDESIELTKGDAYQLVYDILEYLDENEP